MKSLKEVAEKYGFGYEEEDTHKFLLAKNTEGAFVRWIRLSITESGLKAIHVRGNTDYLSLWFYATRKDLTAEDLIMFVKELNECQSKTKAAILLWDLIDSEDWQEITRISDACEDERFLPQPKKESAQNIAIEEDEIFNCDDCEYRECFDCPKALGQEVAIFTFGSSSNEIVQ